MAYRIIVVDDQRDIRDTLEGLLTMRGYEVITAADGMEAVTKTQKYKPDLMVLDVAMPRMTGFQTCQMIRKLEGYSDIPVIFLTAKKAESDKKFGERMGGDVYVTKPYNQNQLMHTIEKLLKERAHPDAQRERLDKIEGSTHWQD